MVIDERDPFMKRMAAEKAISGTPAVCTSGPSVSISRSSMVRFVNDGTLVKKICKCSVKQSGRRRILSVPSVSYLLTGCHCFFPYCPRRIQFDVWSPAVVSTRCVRRAFTYPWHYVKLG